MARKQHLSLADATEDQIEPMQNGTLEEDSNDEPAVNEERAPKIFSHADDVERLGKAIIGNDYSKVKGERFEFIYVSETFKQDGEECLCKAQKVQGINAYLAQLFNNGVEPAEGPGDPFFLILISKPMWEAMEFDAKTAVLDNVLWQCHRRDNGAIYIRKPEIKTSVEVLHRRGLYNNKLKDAGRVIKKHLDQASLLDEAV
jgi:hypothetical protein